MLESARRSTEPTSPAPSACSAARSASLAFGLGPSGPLASYFALRLRPVRGPGAVRSPRAASCWPTSSSRPLPGTPAAPRPTSGSTVDADVDARPAPTRLGLPVVLLTDSLGAKLADRVEVTLPALRSRRRGLAGAAATIAVLDALLLALAAREPGRSLATLTELNDLRKRLRGRPARPRSSGDALPGSRR